MADFDVTLEIHSPGLNLHRERMNMHRLFMSLVHDCVGQLATAAYRCYEEEGRGVIVVSAATWMEIVKDGMWPTDDDDRLRVDYLLQDDRRDGVEEQRLRGGYREMVRDYDPEKEFVMLVNHHPGDLLSAYLLCPSPDLKKIAE